MKQTLGKKINELRKQRNMTQDELAERMGVSPQAVSKWETDLSIPDLPVLISLADFFHLSLDELVREKEDQVQLLPPEQRKDINDMLLRVNIQSIDGDTVRVNLPLALVKIAADMKMELPEMKGSDLLKKLDFDLIFSLIEKGAIGKIVEVHCKDGDNVEVTVE